MDGTLVERARAGDADAFDELVRGRIDAVYRTALGILGQPADARDVTQEALILAWRRLPSLRDPERFDAWLQTITLNSCRVAIRRRRRVRELHLIDTATGVSADPSLAASVRDPTGAAFDRAFARLSVEQRALLLDHHLDGRGIDEIAHRLRIPGGTVKSRLHTARQALARALEEDHR